LEIKDSNDFKGISIVLYSCPLRIRAEETKITPDFKSFDLFNDYKDSSTHYQKGI
jgi:hypothetical protein